MPRPQFGQHIRLERKDCHRSHGSETPPHWRLTPDTGTDLGKLTAEYITNGKVIKVGNGEAVAAAEGIVNDLMVSLTHPIATSQLLTSVL